MIVRPNTLPEPRPVDMEGSPVDLDPPEPSWWDRAWVWLFGAAIGGLTREGDRV